MEDSPSVSLPYVANPFCCRRRITREVRVGGVGIGAGNPIRVQSMTNTDTLNTKATVDQIERLADAGCELARATAPSIREAANLREIRAEMRRRGLHLPLVADIHFTPRAAMIAAQYVEKVRINPGNYADKKKFERRDYDDRQYADELERVAERFRPLARRCKQRGVAMRIGTNHGSLSDRIMSRYGDTPLGMVESALEFLEVCEDEGFGDVVFSMKASNTQVAIQAYRLLAARLAERAPDELGYPFHLGVTEAGGAEDGRIKSAIGIGALLEDGIGDTIRVSLTEDPAHEIPVAIALARRAEALWMRDAEDVADPKPAFVVDPYSYLRRRTRRLTLGGLALGGQEPVRVELRVGRLDTDCEESAARLVASLAALGEVSCESLLVCADSEASLARVSGFAAALERAGVAIPLALEILPELAADAARLGRIAARVALGVEAGRSESLLAASVAELACAGHPLELCVRGEVEEVSRLLDRALEAVGAAGQTGNPPLVSVESPDLLHAVRIAVARLRERGEQEDLPVALRCRPQTADWEGEPLLAAAESLGALLCDGIGDMISVPPSLAGSGDPATAVDLAYRILQGARLRTTRTEYISCPSCGRTLFDLEQTAARVKSRTEHLVGLKIAVMGCIVNGPGEMADADFGYVGSGPGKVTLYAGKQIVARSVPEEEAPDRLVDLIRERGRWEGS
jgi:(E)-4-hydroxy-3-methylbut-2-enyl-diphosphate synthase